MPTKRSAIGEPSTATTRQRPVDPSLHPIETGNYRIATPAIQTFYELIQRCLRYRITGALAYGPPRIGMAGVNYLVRPATTMLAGGRREIC